MDTIVIYGATGYAGRLTARIAVERGLRPVLAGRDGSRLAALRSALDLPVRVAPLDDPAALDRLLADAAVVLNAAGPFATTQPPLVAACLRTGTHYLDLSGEAAEFLAVHERDPQLRSAGIMAMPGVGFGVVPTDAVAVHLARRFPAARQLALSFVTTGGVFRGTLDTLLGGLAGTGVQRRHGRLAPARAGAARPQFTHDGTTSTVVTNPWRGDVVSAFVSTGIPDISTYFAVPAVLRLLMRLAALAPGLVTSAPGRRARQALLRRLPAGPTPSQLAAGSSLVHGVASDDAGATAVAVWTGPDAYLVTAHAAAELLARTAGGKVLPGFRTPAQLHGPEIALTVPGAVLRDVA